MALQEPSLKLWNKCENITMLSEVGPHGVVTGIPTFPAGRFGNCIHLDVSGNTKHITFPNLITFADCWINSFWWKPDYDSTDGTIHWLMYDLVFGVKYEGFAVYYHAASKRLWALVWDESAYVTRVRYLSFTFSATTWYHLAFVYDVNLLAENRVILYVNAIQTPGTIYAGNNNPWSMGTLPHNLVYDQVGSIDISCAFDNIKICEGKDDLQSILDNRNEEGYDVAGAKRLVNGFRSPLVESILAH